jgi:peptidoglycan/LPS O-acetylase OafA/YrhL
VSWALPLAATGNSERLRGIDILRGVAILSVLAIHIPHEAPGGWREHPFFLPAFLADFGYLGVSLFIVISGFCIHRRAALLEQASGRYAFGWVAFWKRRFIRLYPPYAAAMVLSLLCAFLLHQRIADPGQLLGWDLATHVLLIHNLTDEYATGLGNGAFWSLGTEEQLYALYALLLILLTRLPLRVAVLIVAAVTLSWRLTVAHFPDSTLDVGAFHLGTWYQWPTHYWFHWMLGAVAVDAALGNTRLPRWCRSGRWAALLIAAGFALNRNTFELLAHTRLPLAFLADTDAPTLRSLSDVGELVMAVGFFCLMNTVLRAEGEGAFGGRIARAVAAVGKVSYSLYLVHIPMIYVLEQSLPLGHAPVEWLLRYAIYGAVVLLAGVAFHHAVERWFLSGRWPRWTARAQPVPAEGT